MTSCPCCSRGRGLRVEDELLTLDPLSVLYVEAETLRPVFNDTDVDAVSPVVRAPPETANTLEMTPEQLACMNPERLKGAPAEPS